MPQAPLLGTCGTCHNNANVGNHTLARFFDLGKMKVPTLRGLARRAPYFHNGGAATLNNVVTFYNARFRMGLSPQNQADLVAFLQAL